MIAELLFLAFIFATAAVFYWCGKRDGYKEGWFAGHQHATARGLPPSHVSVRKVR